MSRSPRRVDEGVGHHQAAAGMPPARQRLEPGQTPCLQVHDGLVVDDPLLAFDGPAKISLELQLSTARRVHVRVEDFMAGAASSLGAIERGVGIAEHVIVARVARAGQRDADADEVKTSVPTTVRGNAMAFWMRSATRTASALAVQIVEQNRD